MEPRIPPLEPPYPEPLARALEAMMPPGVPPLRLFRTVAHNPRILEKLRGANLLDRGSLERRDRELVILRTCARCGSEYEWGVHVAAFARRVGLGAAELAGSLAARPDPAVWPARDLALLALVDELHERSDVGDATWDALSAHFDEAQRIELLLLVGLYHAVSFLTNALRLPPETGAPRFAEARAPGGDARPRGPVA